MSWLHLGEMAALATALLWTLSALAWTFAGRHVGALAVSFLRLILACAMMMAYGYFARGLWFPSDAGAETWLLLGVSGIFGFFLCDVCLFKAMLLIGPRLSLLIFSLVPPMAAVVSWCIVGDVLGLRHWVAMGVTLAGVAWVVLEQPEKNGRTGLPRYWGQGIALALFAAATQAIAQVIAKEGIGDYDAVAGTLIRALASLPGYAAFITFRRRWPAMLGAMRHRRAMMIVALGAVVGPFAGVALNMVALRHVPTGVVTTLIATMPVMILPFSVLLFHEKVSVRAVGGAVIAVAGVAMLTL